MNYQNCFVAVTKPERQEETALSPKVLVACNRDSKTNEQKLPNQHLPYSISLPYPHTPNTHKLSQPFIFLKELHS